MRWLTFRQSSGPRPRRSVTPGRIPSMTTSACRTSSSTVATASGSLRLSATLGRPRLSSIVAPPASPCPPGRSTRITSAPRSARIMHACGPGPIPAISTTFTPRSGPVPCPSWYVMSRIMTEVVSRSWSLVVAGQRRSAREHAPQELPGPLLAGFAEDLRGRALLEDPALVQEADRGGDVAGEGHLVGRDHHRHAGLGLGAHDRQHLADQLGVEGR